MLRRYGYWLKGEQNGTLRPCAPADESLDTYVYDSSDPSPSVPGVMERPTGPVDQRPIERRPDVLVYTTPPLEHDTEVTGPVVARLWAATSAVDTDWVVRLLDVYPDGYAFPLTERMIRARYREPQTTQKLLEPNRVYEHTIELRPVGNLFKAGHRIRVVIAGATFSQFDADMNTGGVFGTESGGVAATQCVFHDASRPSHVVLPMVPRPSRF
jgi:putative CocE/NonD family hydrolase